MYRDPTKYVDFFSRGYILIVGGDHVVGCIPIESAGDVGELSREMGRGIGIDLPAQSWFQKQPIGCRWEEGKTGKGKLHVAVHLDERLTLLSIDVLTVRGIGQPGD